MKIRSFFLLFILPLSLLAQEINTKNIQIVRDQWGVPHIFSKTDAEAAYGIAWAHAEDNFADMQIPILAVRGLYAEVDGIEGAILDAINFLIETDELVEENYEQTFSPEFKKILGAYTLAVNRYAELHPKEIRHKKLFPINEKDIIKGYVLMTTFISNVHYDLLRIFGDKLGPIDPLKLAGGSNGFAFSPNKMADGKTYLVCNSHQPLTGNTAWYELSVHSEEGWEFMGATFAGGVTPFIGTNPDLGWTHTVNFDDFHDVYKLRMHPSEKNKYAFDGEWLELEERIFRIKVKIAGIKFPIKRKFYTSIYGPTIKNKSGYYSLRFPANMVLGQAEQWYKMNKARTAQAFEEALEMQQLANLDVIYADKKGNITFLGNGLFPHRDPNYNWNKLLPGDTSATLWPEIYRPIDSLQLVKNPDCGYVFNVNNTGLHCTCEGENPKPDLFPENQGWLHGNTARGYRVKDLMQGYDKMSYEDIKTVKYDGKYSLPIQHRTMQNVDFLREMDVREHPEISASIRRLRAWDGGTEASNPHAAIVSMIFQYLLEYTLEEGVADQNGSLPEEEYINAVHYAQHHILKHFGTLDITLGDLQRHVRGAVNLPIGGLPETLTSMYTSPYKKGRLESQLGESFIQFVVYNENGVEKIETVNCYGASNHPESKHYTDQMELFTQQKLKEMTLDREVIFEGAERVYYPK